MATSGTYSSSFPIDELLDQAIPLAGGEPTLGQDIRQARRALRLLLRDIQTRGVRLSQVDEYSVSVSSTTTPLPESVMTVLDGVFVQDGTDFASERIGFSDYLRIPRKGQSGRPTSFYVDEKRDSKTLYVWPVPSSTTTFKFFAMRRSQEPGAMSLDLDVHERYWTALVFGLAYWLSLSRAPDRSPFLKGEYEAALDLAAGDDRERQTFRVVPKVRRR